MSASGAGKTFSLLQTTAQAGQSFVSVKSSIPTIYLADVMPVYVVLFNARTENEGIHSLQVEGRHLVLMFEMEDDALRFGGLLEAQDFPPASVEAFEMEEIEEFCQGAGYEAVNVPDGTLLMPPEKMVESTTWDPDSTPDPTSQGSIQDASSTEMDRIRQQLEKLL